jgi:carbon-monoxide dehydrogenase medium subunit
MKLPLLDYIRPATLADAIALLEKHGSDAKIIAGGQSLMPLLAFRLLSPKLLIDIGRLPDLGHVNMSADAIDIGALVTWRDIERDPRLADGHPLLAAAIAHVAHYQIRNRGTVGGSLAHADPAAEMMGIAVTCDAQVTIAGPAGLRIVPFDKFCTGSLSTVLEPNELVISVRLPAWRKQRRWGFEEFARRRGDFALAGVAIYYDRTQRGQIIDAHIGVFGVADRPMRLTAVEDLINGQMLDAQLVIRAAELARTMVDPPDDIHASADYRRDLLGVLLERALARAGEIAMAEAA